MSATAMGVGALLLALALASCGRVPAPVRWYLGADDERVLWYQPTTERVVALTIDDGPFAETTDQILDALARHDARATFFLIGAHAAAEPDAVRRILLEGHEIGNHMLHDEPSAALSTQTFRAQYLQTDSILRALGARPVWFRPGAGRFSDGMLEFLCEQGAVSALGDVYPFDTVITAKDFTVDFVVRRSQPGSVVILHDGPERGPRTARALDRALPLLEEDGYRVVTLTELVGERALARAAATCEWPDG